MSLLLSIILLSTFPKIDQAIPEGPFSYPGQSIREVITVDPDNSPLLQQACTKLKEQLEGDILLKTLLFVQENLFDDTRCTNENLSHLIQNFGGGQLEPDIPLEVFLEEKTGVCRHIALTTTYLINDLIREGLLSGNVYLIREQTPFGRHAWTLFLTDNAAWHLDPYWGLLEDGKTRAGFSHLCKKYGKKTMEQQKVWWENAH